ncbi:DUF4270 domain-containing protein [Flavobacterium sp.]|uniref:DUF4270 domain-containing protein n=1 Tax=Flavobacterium sp. TaxID=239 RepID=UPI00286D4A91|nr:DUF4270 domain-containing protein [Flavobacterium sp.]
MMFTHTFLKKLLVVSIVLFFASCDKDFNSLGSDIIGNENFDFDVANFEVKTYNQKVNAIQTNNLAINQLGVYDSPTFGKTQANFVTELDLAVINPTFINKTTISMDSVVLTVPYFSTRTAIDANGKGTYRLESMLGNSPMSLKVFENGFKLENFGTGSNADVIQKYYSDQDVDFSNKKIGFPASANVGTPNGTKLNNDGRNGGVENLVFVPSEKEFVVTTINTAPTPPTISRSAPRMSLHLDTTYFSKRIFKAPASALENKDAFKDYFRGLYFQIENSANGRLMSLDFSKGNVTVYYKEDNVAVNPTSRVQKSIVLNMTGKTVNLFNNTFNTVYQTALNTPNVQNGDGKLYLKGGQGSCAFIDLFTNSNETQAFIAKKPLINDASLTFTIEKQFSEGTEVELQRIYLFDAVTKAPVFDYIFDSSTNQNDASLNKALYGGIIEKNATGRGTQYKIRVTEHVNNIITKNGPNNKLCLVVTTNINNPNNYFLKDEIAPEKVDRLPVASVITPLGTVLYGSNIPNTDTENYAKRVKLQIYYTKPN